MGPGRRAVLALGLLCVLVGGIYAATSPGTYQDDDVDRFYMARHALKEPALFLHAWGMPVPLLLLSVPSAAAGYPGAEFTTVILTAGAAVLTGLAAAEAGFSLAWLAVLFVFFQPMVLNLSYSAMGEPAAAAILALALWFWYRRRPGAALIAAGWLPLARIDAGFLTLVLLAAGWRRSGWRPRLLALAPVVVWSGLSALVSGNPLGILGGGHRPLNSLGPAHYAVNAVSTAGPVILFCFLWAMIAFLWKRRASESALPAQEQPPAPEPPSAGSGPRRRGKGKRTKRASARPRGAVEAGFPVLALVLALGHLGLLSLLAWQALPIGRSIGFLRHVVTTAPALGMVAVWGAERWLGAGREPRALRFGFAAAWTAVVALFLSRKLVADTFFVDERVEWRWIATAVTAGLGIPAALGSRPTRRTLALVLGAAACAVTLITVRPIQLDPERAAIQQAVDYINKWDGKQAVVYTNHPWFDFLDGRDRYDKVHTPDLTLDALEHARAGSFVLWENHYGNRLFGNVPLERLSRDPRFERLLELRAGTKQNFHVVVFRRLA